MISITRHLNPALGILCVVLTACATTSPPPTLSKAGLAESSPSTATKYSLQAIPFIGASKVYRATLANGLRVLIVPEHSSPTIAVQTWFDVGSRNEKTDYTGLAHLFEHMMFKGTKNHSDGEFDRILERAGAEGENAFTSEDYTAYVQEMPKAQLDLILSLESDRMVNLIVDQKTFKTETEVVQNERRFRNENNPDGIMWQTMFESAFTVHPYHWPVIGYQPDLERMNATDAEAFYKKFYRPNRACLIIVGDVEPDMALATVEKYYDAIARAPDPQETLTPEPPQTQVIRKSLRLSTPVEKLLISYRIPGLIHDDTPVLQTIQALLFEGKGSRLQRALVDTGIASTISGGNYENKDPSIFMVKVNLQKGKKTAIAESVILQELQKLGLTAVSQKELTRALNFAQFNLYESLLSNPNKAHFLGHYEIIGHDFQSGLKLFDSLKKVTSADIQRVAQAYFSPQTRTVIMGIPK